MEAQGGRQVQGQVRTAAQLSKRRASRAGRARTVETGARLHADVVNVLVLVPNVVDCWRVSRGAQAAGE